ncbi:MAG: SapC family protein [Desulfohalobiaceae bacterium]|nr:SapC family protein [Desulfohalobiaceae bacterium]
MTPMPASATNCEACTCSPISRDDSNTDPILVFTTKTGDPKAPDQNFPIKLSWISKERFSRLPYSNSDPATLVMYKTLEHLDPSRHRHLLFDHEAGYAFARNITVCPLTPAEVPEAAKEYPVVFSQEGPCLAQAILFAGHGEHPFLSEHGSWLGRHLPVYLRNYPFILGTTENNEHFNLMADIEAPHFQTGQGQPLFTADDAPGELLQKRIDQLKNFLNGLRVMHKLLSPLRQEDFFSNDPLLVQDKQDKGLRLEGFSTVRPKTLSSLEPQKLKTMVQNGLLDVFFAHLHSLTNFAPILQASGGIIQIDTPPHYTHLIEQENTQRQTA